MAIDLNKLAEELKQRKAQGGKEATSSVETDEFGLNKLAEKIRQSKPQAAREEPSPVESDPNPYAEARAQLLYRKAMNSFQNSSGFEEVLRSLPRGFLAGGGEMLGSQLRATSDLLQRGGLIKGDPTDYDDTWAERTGQSIQDYTQKQVEERPWLQPDPLHTNWFSQAAESTGQMAAGAAINLPLAFTGSPTAFAAGMGVTYGMSAYQSVLDRAQPLIEAGELSEEDAFEAAVVSGLAEGATEMAADRFFLGLSKFGGKFTGPAKEGVKRGVLKFLQPTLSKAVRNMVLGGTGEAVTESITAVIQNEQEREIGLTTAKTMDAVAEVYGPSFIMGAFFGLGGNVYQRSKFKGLVKDINGDDPRKQIDAIDNVYRQLYAQDPNIARSWLKASYTAVLTDQKIDLETPLAEQEDFVPGLAPEAEDLAALDERLANFDVNIAAMGKALENVKDKDRRKDITSRIQGMQQARARAAAARDQARKTLFQAEPFDVSGVGREEKAAEGQPPRTEPEPEADQAETVSETIDYSGPASEDIVKAQSEAMPKLRPEDRPRSMEPGYPETQTEEDRVSPEWTYDPGNEEYTRGDGEKIKVRVKKLDNGNYGYEYRRGDDYITPSKDKSGFATPQEAMDKGDAAVRPHLVPVDRASDRIQGPSQPPSKPTGPEPGRGAPQGPGEAIRTEYPEAEAEEDLASPEWTYDPNYTEYTIGDGDNVNVVVKEHSNGNYYYEYRRGNDYVTPSKDGAGFATIEEAMAAGIREYTSKHGEDPTRRESPEAGVEPDQKEAPEPVDVSEAVREEKAVEEQSPPQQPTTPEDKRKTLEEPVDETIYFKDEKDFNRQMAEAEAVGDTRKMGALAREMAKRRYTDPLTGLKSRAAFDEAQRIEQEEGGGQRTWASIDGKGIKYVNDTFGHSVGDELISLIGRAFGRDGQGQDSPVEAFRVGGDEFAIRVKGERSEAEIKEAIDKANAWLQDNKLIVEHEGRMFEYIPEFRYAEGQTFQEADERLAETTRSESGTGDERRSKDRRRQKPPGFIERTTGSTPQDRRKAERRQEQQPAEEIAEEIPETRDFLEQETTPKREPETGTEPDQRKAIGTEYPEAETDDDLVTPEWTYDPDFKNYAIGNGEDVNVIVKKLDNGNYGYEYRRGDDFITSPRDEAGFAEIEDAMAAGISEYKYEHGGEDPTKRATEGATAVSGDPQKMSTFGREMAERLSSEKKTTPKREPEAKKDTAKTATEEKLFDAYSELVEETGFSSVGIYHLQQASGLPMDKVKETLREMGRDGRAVFARGDWSLSTPEEREGQIEINGIPQLVVRLDTEKKPPKKTETRITETTPEQKTQEISGDAEKDAAALKSFNGTTQEARDFMRTQYKTVAALKRLAKEMGIKNYSRMKKADLEAAIVGESGAKLQEPIMDTLAGPVIEPKPAVEPEAEAEVDLDESGAEDMDAEPEFTAEAAVAKQLDSLEEEPTKYVEMEGKTPEALAEELEWDEDFLPRVREEVESGWYTEQEIIDSNTRVFEYISELDVKTAIQALGGIKEKATDADVMKPVPERDVNPIDELTESQQHLSALLDLDGNEVKPYLSRLNKKVLSSIAQDIGLPVKGKKADIVDSIAQKINAAPGKPDTGKKADVEPRLSPEPPLKKQAASVEDAVRGAARKLGVKRAERVLDEGGNESLLLALSHIEAETQTGLAAKIRNFLVDLQDELRALAAEQGFSKMQPTSLGKYKHQLLGKSGLLTGAYGEIQAEAVIDRDLAPIVEAVDAYIDKLFGVDKKSVVQYVEEIGDVRQRTSPQPRRNWTPPERSKAEERVKKLISKTVKKPNVTVIESIDDLPAEKRRLVPQRGLLVQGLFFEFDNSIYIISGNHQSLAQIEETLAHEMFHEGLRPVLGERFDAVLDGIAVQQNLPGNTVPQKRKAAEEWLTDKAVRGDYSNGMFQKAIGLLRDFLRKIGFNLSLNDADLARMIIQTKQHAYKKGGVKIRGGKVPANGVYFAAAGAEKLDQLTKAYTNSDTFGDLLNAEVPPSFWVDEPEQKYLADQYDSYQEMMGNPIRAYRDGESLYDAEEADAPLGREAEVVFLSDLFPEGKPDSSLRVPDYDAIMDEAYEMETIYDTSTDRYLGETPLRRPLRKEQQRRLLQAWGEMAKKTKAFRLPKSKSKDIHKVAQEIGGEKVTVERKRKGNKTVWHLKTSQGYIRIIPASNNNPNHFYIDSSFANQYMGSTLHQIALTWAHNNDFVMLPDTAGYTPINLLRYIENMISSALRHRTTKHLWPSSAHRLPSWEAGQHGQNIVSLLTKARELVYRYLPQLQGMTYDFDGQTVRDANGKPISDEELSDMLNLDQVAPVTGTGLTTVKRAIISDTILRDKRNVLQNKEDLRLFDNALYSKESQTGEAVSLDDIKKVFKGQRVSVNKDGSVSVDTHGGRSLKINYAKHIGPDVVEVQFANDGKQIQGRYINNTITLKKDTADRWTLYHETTHWLEDSGILSKAEVAVLRDHIRDLIKKGKIQRSIDNGGVEDRARFIEASLYRDDLAGAVQKTINKIRRWVAKLAELAGVHNRSVYGILHDIESGSIYGRRVGDRMMITRKPSYSEAADTYYSQMYRTMEKKLPGSGPAQQIKQTIKSWRDKGEIKSEELEWSGLLEWLDKREGKVTKEDVLGYLRANEIKLETVVFPSPRANDPAYWEVRRENLKRKLSITPNLTEWKTRLKKFNIDAHDYFVRNKEKPWVITWDREVTDKDLEAGRIGDPENPITKEFLENNNRFKTKKEAQLFMDKLGLPEDDGLHGFVVEKDEWEFLFSKKDELYQRVDDIPLFELFPDEERHETFRELTPTKYDRYQTPGPKSNYREIIMTLPLDADRGVKYTSSHWSGRMAPNPVVHFRVSERLDVDNNRILYVDEIQSDWAQEGREKGYWDEQRPVWRFDDRKVNLENLGAEYTDKVEAEDAAEILGTVLPKKRKGYGAPHQPFKKTETWALLAFKKILRMAAEGGFDGVAWTPGQVQSDRYSFENINERVERIYYRKKSNDNFFVAFDLGLGNYGKVFKGSELDKIFGKDVADKMRRGKGALSAWGGGRRLPIPQGVSYDFGKGMKGFYDNILPKAVGKYTKKWGGKVGTTTINEGQEVWHIPINERMKREAVYEGQPLFAKHRAPEALRDMFGEEKKESVADKVGKALSRTSLVDRLHPILKLGEKGQTSNSKEIAHQLYTRARNTAGGAGQVEGLIKYGPLTVEDGQMVVDVKSVQKNGAQGLEQIMKDLRRDLKDGDYKSVDPINLFYWMAAKRAEEDLPKKKDYTEKLMDQERRDRVFKTIAERNDKHFIEAARKVRVLNNSIIEAVHRLGFIDAALADRMKADSFYVPYYRVFEEISQQEETKRPGFNVQSINTGIKKILGSDRRIGDPLQNLLHSWVHLTREAQRNKVIDDTINFIEEQQIEGMVDKVRSPSITSKHIITFQQNGQQVHYRINDPELFNALTQINIKSLKSAGDKFFAWHKRILTAGATMVPTFWLRNLIRDPLHTSVIHKGFNPWDAVKGAAKIIRNHPDYIAFKTGGGAFSGSYLQSQNARASEVVADRLIKKFGGKAKVSIIDSPNKVIHFMSYLAEISENASRVGLYSRLRKKGVGHSRAVYEGRDIMDFSLSGSGEGWVGGALQFLVNTVPFMGARIQGLYKIARSGGDLVRNPKENKAMALKGLALFMAGYLLYEAFKDDEDYKKLNDYEKRMFYFAKIGDHKIFIPKPFEMGALLGTLPVAFAESMEGREDWEYFKKMLTKTAMDTFSFNPLPQAYRPMIELWANKSFYRDAPIEGFAQQRRLPADRTKYYTSPLAQSLARTDVGEALGLSPLKTEHAIRAYFATVGSMTLHFMDMATRGAMGFPDIPDYNPLTEAFVKTREPGTTKHTQEFYEKMVEAEQAYASMQYCIQTGDLTRFEEIKKEFENLVAWRKAANKVRGSMSKINNRIELIALDPNKTDEEKQSLIDELNKTKNEIAVQAMEYLKEINKGKVG
jgi:diguanylate cyclase (GGDEF)-like protein